MVLHMYELAQLNIARMLSPLDDPRMADFVAGLDPVNAAADSAPGFVWRLQTEDGNATAIRMYDEWLIVNASVWSSVEALIAFVYSDAHRAVLRRRREWFERLAEATTVLWWVPAGHRPDVVEAQQRLEQGNPVGDGGGGVRHARLPSGGVRRPRGVPVPPPVTAGLVDQHPPHVGVRVARSLDPVPMPEGLGQRLLNQVVG